MSRRLAGPAVVEKAIEASADELERLLATLGAESLVAPAAEEPAALHGAAALSILLNEILILAGPASSSTASSSSTGHTRSSCST